MTKSNPSSHPLFSIEAGVAEERLGRLDAFAHAAFFGADARKTGEVGVLCMELAGVLTTVANASTSPRRSLDIAIAQLNALGHGLCLYDAADAYAIWCGDFACSLKEQLIVTARLVAPVAVNVEMARDRRGR